MTPVLRILRRAWRRLTSMRTALVLLFLLAVAAVPGSLLPQRPLNPTKIDAYIAEHGAWGRFLDRLGMFDVFGSAWFAAIYLLLFVSLVGCLVPRIRLHAKAMRAKPLPAPKTSTGCRSRDASRPPPPSRMRLRHREPCWAGGGGSSVATRTAAYSPCRPRRATAARPAT